jgi:hypothetical protein
MLRRVRNVWLTSLIAGATAAGLAFSCRPAGWLPGFPLTEDAFYALSVSRQLALGNGFTIDGALPTNGFQPLWVVLLVPVFGLFQYQTIHSLRGVLAVSTVLWVCSAALLARRARRMARAIGVDDALVADLSFVLWLGSFPLFAQFHNGLETGLTLLVILLTVEWLDAFSSKDTWGLADVGILGLLLAICFYARQDTVFLIASLGCLVVFRTLRGQPSGVWWAAFSVAALAMLPWMIRNVTLDGNMVPTSGRAEALDRSVRESISGVLYAVGTWTLPARSLPVGFTRASVVWAGAGLVLVALAAWPTRRALRTFAAEHIGTQALLGHLTLLAVFYGFFFGAAFFADRYLAPFVLVTIPVLAGGLAGWAKSHRSRVFIRGIAAVFGVVSLISVIRLAGIRHSSAFYDEQVSFAAERVDPACVVGALQTGTIGYFRDNVVNLDGKVNYVALRALSSGTLPQYVATSDIDVVIDWPALCRQIVGETAAFFRSTTMGRFEVWVRKGRSACVQEAPLTW